MPTKKKISAVKPKVKLKDLKPKSDPKGGTAGAHLCVKIVNSGPLC
jgi:hypothetical protein